jgi:hypothetical protein
LEIRARLAASQIIDEEEEMARKKFCQRTANEPRRAESDDAEEIEELNSGGIATLFKPLSKRTGIQSRAESSEAVSVPEHLCKKACVEAAVETQPVDNAQAEVDELNELLGYHPLKNAKHATISTLSGYSFPGRDCEDPARNDKSAGHNLATNAPGVSSNTPEWRTPGPQVEIPAPKPASDLGHFLPGVGRRGAAAMGVEGGDAGMIDLTNSLASDVNETSVDQTASHDKQGERQHGEHAFENAGREFENRKQASETEDDDTIGLRVQGLKFGQLAVR